MNHHKNIKKLYIGLLLLGIGLFVLWFYQIKTEKPMDSFVNQIRLMIHPIYEEYRETNLDTDFENPDNISLLLKNEQISKQEIYASFVDLTGKIVYSTNPSLQVNDVLFLDESLYMDQSYTYQNVIHSKNEYYKISMPLYQDYTVTGFIIFEVRQDQFIEAQIPFSKKASNVLAIILSGILILLLVFGWIGLFYKKNEELDALQIGLSSICRGQFEKIELKAHKNNYNDLYIAYNNMIEELSYMLQQQAMNESKRTHFLTIISHELKTPIATISASVEGLLNGVATKNIEIQNRYLSTIQKKMMQLTAQINELFAYAQKSSDQFKYHFNECYCNELFDNIMKILESERSIKINIQNKIPKCIVNVDQIRIEQVVLNIYNNAIKHSKNNSLITILGYRQDYEVFIEISDNGNGIEPADLPYIFDYYYQGNLSKKEDYEGIGLGLAICREIILKHSGQIKVKSQLGIGTTFTIQLPIA